MVVAMIGGWRCGVAARGVVRWTWGAQANLQVRNMVLF